MTTPNYPKIIKELNKQQVWISKRITLVINSEQYQAIVKGYNPHWEMRYGIIYNNFDQYFYAYRSDYLVGKYKFEKHFNSNYICSEMFENSNFPDCLNIFEIVLEACSQNNVKVNSNEIISMFELTKGYY